MNDFRNFQASHNLKLITINNPKIIDKNTINFFNSNIIIVQSPIIKLPSYNEFNTKLNIKVDDILVYTLIFDKTDTVKIQYNECQSEVIKTDRSQFLLIKFYNNFYEVY